MSGEWTSACTKAEVDPPNFRHRARTACRCRKAENELETTKQKIPRNTIIDVQQARVTIPREWLYHCGMPLLHPRTLVNTQKHKYLEESLNLVKFELSKLHHTQLVTRKVIHAKTPAVLNVADNLYKVRGTNCYDLRPQWIYHHHSVYVDYSVHMSATFFTDLSRLRNATRPSFISVVPACRMQI